MLFEQVGKLVVFEGFSCIEVIYKMDRKSA